MRRKLAFIRRAYMPVVERARREFDTAYLDRQLPPDEALRLIADHEAEAIFFTSTFKFDAAFIVALPPRVKVAASASTFLDHADLEAAKKRGLVVTCAPDVVAGCVADLAFGLIIGAARGFSRHARTMREGTWSVRTMGEGLGTRVWGKTLGIIGYGRVGRAMVERAKGFGMTILCHDPKPVSEPGVGYFADLDAMLPRCDFVSVSARLTPGTRHLLDRRRLEKLPKGAFVVNSARGGLIDEQALIALLESGHLGGAGLDVFEREPDFNRRLAELDNVFLTPHINSATHESRLELGYKCLDDIAAALAATS
ncbi:MAG TPA: NAD(P)-dependent oxidoreductase [Reyranella sp.]|nr:NAD(P)-dependent oxidoreductase [Reyranella sp.]